MCHESCQRLNNSVFPYMGVCHLQCTCHGCAKDIMAAGGLCPMCRASIHSTITARF